MQFEISTVALWRAVQERARCNRAWGMTVMGVGLIALTSPAYAGATEKLNSSAEREIARCIRQAARGKSWLERTLWGLRDQEAGWIGAAVANANGTHDLGPLQINSWWVPRIATLVERPAAHVRYWLRYDPCFNAEAARWIFLSGLAVTGDYWKAVGIYHSPTGWRQSRYAASVTTHLRRRFGPEIFTKPLVK
jgi:hypothetical protein